MPKYHGTRDVKKEHYGIRHLLDAEKKKEILTKAFLERVGYPMNWEDPKTFNEKIMWSKLYYQDPLITKCCDKYAVKDYVAEKIGKQYFVPTIATWNNPDDIDFDKLPNQFVLKVNWSSGYNIIVQDKSKLNIQDTKNKLKAWMKPDRNGYYQFFNWGYKHMKPVIYAEEYLEQIAGQVYDYKFFMCNGKMEFMLIATNRSNDDELTHDFFDSEFNHIPVIYGELKQAVVPPEKPKNYDKMIELAEKLAKPFPFVRVDFYEIGDDIYLGEMTFYPAGGLKPFYPLEYDYRLGEKISFPGKRIVDKEGMTFQMNKIYHEGIRELKINVKSLRRKLIRKERVKNRKYLRVFGIRLPYETHFEDDGTTRRKYIRILGIEFCYKKLPPLKCSRNDIKGFEYEMNPPKLSYIMEEKITPEMKRIHCEQKAYKQLGYFPNLRNPKSLNEKIIWLALNYKNEHIAVAADKSKAKKWLAERIGKEYLIPDIGVYYDVNDIDFDALPNQFVAKLNDGWGADEVMIVRDKSELNVDRTKAILSSWLYPWKNYYYQNMCITDEKMERPAIIIEDYVQQGETGQLDDYKIYCCNGEPRFALVVTGRGTEHQARSFVDMDWNVLPFARKGKSVSNDVVKPSRFDEMLEIARKLSSDFPFVRVDFYEVNDKVYVGEMTFTPGMFLQFTSKEWDFKLGEYIKLPFEVTQDNGMN